MADQSGQIQTNALKPAEASDPAGSMRQFGIAEQIQADRYAAANTGARTKNRGIRFSKILPAGPVSDQQGNNPTGGLPFDHGSSSL